MIFPRAFLLLLLCPGFVVAQDLSVSGDPAGGSAFPVFPLPPRDAPVPLWLSESAGLDEALPVDGEDAPRDREGPALPLPPLSSQEGPLADALAGWSGAASPLEKRLFRDEARHIASLHTLYFGAQDPSSPLHDLAEPGILMQRLPWSRGLAALSARGDQRPVLEPTPLGVELMLSLYGERLAQLRRTLGPCRVPQAVAGGDTHDRYSACQAPVRSRTGYAGQPQRQPQPTPLR